MNLEPFLVDVSTACRLLRISRSYFYRGLSTGRIPLKEIRFGRKRLYDIEQVRSFVKSGCSPQWRPDNAD